MTRLAQVLLAYQQKHDVDAKKLAREIGISASSLCRLKQGKTLDAAGFVKVMTWLAG